MLPRDIIDHIAAFVGAMHPDGTVADVNEATLRVLGFGRSSVIGAKLWECPWFAHDSREIARVRHAVERAAQGETLRFDVTASTAEGVLLTIDLMIDPLRDASGKIIGLIPSGVDRTERKRFEDELQRSLDLLERAQRIGQLGYWSYDVISRKLELSDQARRIYFGEMPAEVSADGIESLIFPEDRQRVRDAMMEGAAKCQRVAISYRIRRADGEEHVLEIEADPEYGPSGEPVRMFGIVRDVTRARTRERRLREQQQLIDLSQLPIFYWDLDGGLLHWSNGCQQLYGYTREEALGRAPRELLKTKYPLSYAELEKHLRSGNWWDGEVIQTTRDGRQVIVEVRLDPVASDGRILVMEDNRDVTAQREAEKRLRVSEERLAIAADLTGLGTIDRDFSTNTIYLSPQPCGAVIGEEVSLEGLLAHIHTADQPRVRAALAESEDPAGTGLYEAEHRVVRPSGEVRWISVKARTFFEGEGRDRKPVRTIGALLDVTDRRMFEEQQRLLMGELNHRVRNTLSVVQAIASQTLRSARDPRTFVADFKGRIHAIASAHKLLNETTWQGANLTELIREQLAGTCGSGQIRSEGPEVWLPPQVALNLGLVLHELGTNARKYGALSVPRGRVQISWKVRKENSRCFLRMSWQEFGGPAVKPPTMRGFGMGLIERSIGTAVEGATNISFEPEGVRCVIEVALHDIAATVRV